MAHQPNVPTPLSTSSRERRLWGWALLVVATIYATLGLSQRLVGILPQRDILVGAFILGMVLVGLSVVTHGLRKRPDGVELGVIFGIAATYLLVFVRMATPTERSHLIEYGVVAALVYEALVERANQNDAVRFPGLMAMLITIFIGTLDECIQAFLPSRTFDVVDIVFNVLAAVMAVAASASLKWAVRRRTPAAQPKT